LLHAKETDMSDVRIVPGARGVYLRWKLKRFAVIGHQILLA
jgi:hypothetical protein